MLEEITSSLKTLLHGMRAPAQTISAVIMLCSLARRPGLSCMLSTSKIISELAKKGIPTGKLADGTANLMNEVVGSVVCEVFRAFKEDANLQIAIPPAALTIQVNGANSGGPVSSVGTNITSGKGVGLIQ